MFTVTAHCVSLPPRQVRLPTPIPLVLSDTTAASCRLTPPAAPLPPQRPPRARPPCSRPPPASALLTQPALGTGPLVDDIHDAGTRRATHPALPLSGKFRYRRLPQRRRPLLSPRRAGSPRRAAPTRASRPPALHGRASRHPWSRAACPPARLRLPTVTASCSPVPPARAGCASPLRFVAAHYRDYRRHHLPPLLAAARLWRLLPGSPPPLAAHALPALSPLLTIFLFCQLWCQVPSSPSLTDVGRAHH
jgi:hypothetical protein